MSGTIFVIDQENQLAEMRRSPFSTEAEFQKILADHPALLRLASGTSGDLLLVSQEFGVTDEEGGMDRWSMDHLYLTRNAIPVLVEVKRASDTRGRREVVAQMLDYASHSSAYVSATQLIARFQQTAAAYEQDPEQQLRAFLGDADPEAFWQQVEANLRAGRIRMVFVSDSIGKELRRIVEWLNEQLRSAEVLAIEIGHYTSQSGARTLVPELVGATERAQSVKAVVPHREAIADSDWIESLETRLGPELGSKAGELIGLLTQVLLMRRLPNQKSAGFQLVDASGKGRALFYVSEDTGNLQFAFENFDLFPLLEDEAWRGSLLTGLEQLGVGFKRTEKSIRGWPTVPLKVASSPATWDAFLKLVREILDRANLQNQHITTQTQASVPI